MADSRFAEQRAREAAAKDSRDKIQHAGTKAEAMDLALRAIENFLAAAKAAQSPNDSKAFKDQCVKVMEVAESIQGSSLWPPPGLTLSFSPSAPLPAAPLPTRVQASPALPYPGPSRALPILTKPTRAETTTRVNNWVTDVATSESGTPAPFIYAGSASTTTLPSSGALPGNAGVSSEQEQFSVSNIASVLDSKIAPSTQADPNGHTRALTVQALPITVAQDPMGKTTAPTATHLKIRRLKEPKSSRKFAKKEEIIFLKSSVFNKFKFPPWKDDPSSTEFVLRQDSPYTDERDLNLSPYQQQFFEAWTRPKDALPPPSSRKEGNNGPSMESLVPLDLVQDAATDCSVVASLCTAAARAEQGYDQILMSLIHPQDKRRGVPVFSMNGKYIVRLNFNGGWRKVVIDDRLPLSKTHRVLHIVDRQSPSLLWPALLEKAYLKVRGGYDFPGSNSCSDLWILTGWIPEQIYLQETETVPLQLWNRVFNGYGYGDVLLTLGTGKMSSHHERALGLEGQHSYVVLDMKEIDDDRLVLVKNPWAEGKGWRGPRPAAAAKLVSGTNLANDKARPGKSTEYPTTFWISFDQVIQHFESLYLNWNPGLFTHRQDIHGEWKISEQHEGGNFMLPNPQFAITSEGSGEVWLLLSRHFRDKEGQGEDEAEEPSSGEPLKGYMSVVVCDGHGERLHMKESVVECGPYVNTPQALLRLTLKGRTPYTIIIDQDDLPAATYSFTLSAFGHSAISLEQASSKWMKYHILQGEWTKQSAGGTTDSVRYLENPQYSLELKKPCSVAILLRSNGHSFPMHAKLAFGHGKRMVRLQGRDIVSDSGNYRDKVVFFEAEDVQAGHYTIICSLFEAGKTGKFWLRVDSTDDFVLKQVPRDGAGMFLMKLSVACFGPKVHKLAAPLHGHRLAKYMILARFSRKTLGANGQAPGTSSGHSPLRLTVEIGTGPERKFIVSTEDGKYSDLPVVRSDPFDMEASGKAVGHGNTWLVLDRLYGTGGPVEEWFEVEIYTDAPGVCDVGVWREWN